MKLSVRICSVDWDSVGGLDGHVRSVKEMVTLPLLYPDLFARYKVKAPRGVLFYGPPGTGKTLVARVLAATCSTPEQPVRFQSHPAFNVCVLIRKRIVLLYTDIFARFRAESFLRPTGN